jgi:5-methylcytosine-specific restriction endonuclease McrA
MTALGSVVAAHPLQEHPYNKITFVRIDGNGTPLYRVPNDPRDIGAPEALRMAFQKYGGRCFHCRKALPAQKLSQQCNRDHVRARSRGGRDYLHNLVLTCGDCNRRKGASDLVAFDSERGASYLKALDDHIMRCLEALRNH